MARIKKNYTPSFAREMLNKIKSGEINGQQSVVLRYKLMSAIDEQYRRFFARYGGGAVQPEKRFIEHTCHAMNQLELEYTDYNIFVAACAVCSVLINKYGGMKGLPMVPDVSGYNSENGIAGLMNKIVACHNGEDFD